MRAIVVLAGVDQPLLDAGVPAERRHDRRDLDEVRPGADDVEDPRHPAHGTRAVARPRWPGRVGVRAAGPAPSAISAHGMTVTWPFRETRRFSPAFIVNVTVPWSKRTETVNAPAYGVPTSSAVLVLREEARPAVDDPRVGDPRRRRGHDPDDAAVLVVLAVIADDVHDQPVEARVRRGVAGVLEPADAAAADVERAVAVVVAEGHDVAAAAVEAGRRGSR